MKSYANKLKTSLFYWLSKGRPFIINDEYSVELLFVDTDAFTAKILITNLKNGEQQEVQQQEESEDTDPCFF